MTATSRESIQKIVAPWMREFAGSRTLYSYAVQLDGLAADAVQGIGARYASGPPVLSGVPRTPEALPLLGRDRRIIRGPAEPDVAHIVRLERYLDDWSRAGNAYALMEQVRGYFTPHALAMRVINNTGGAWRTIELDGSKSYLRANPTNWNWSDESAKWSRCWLIIYMPSGPWEDGPAVGDPGLWGGAVGTTGYTVGTTATPEEIAGLRQIVADFKSGATKYEAIVLAFDPSSFDPEAAPGSVGMPDGGWQYQTTNTGDPATAARLSTARYIRGF